MANAARVKYPAALQRCKLDTPLLAAGYLIIDLDEKVTEAVIVARYSFSATDNILYELKKNYEKMKQSIENVGEEETGSKQDGVDVEDTNSPSILP